MTRALIVVDVQNDFCEGGSLAVAGGIAVAASVADLLAGPHGYGVVVATRDHHIDPGFEGRDHTLDIGLADYLRGRGVTDVDVCGIATDYCVRATALDAAASGFATTVLRDLTAAVAPASVDAVCAEWKDAGISVR